MSCFFMRLKDQYKFILTIVVIFTLHVIGQLFFTIKQTELRFYKTFHVTYNILSIFIYLYLVFIKRNRGFVDQQEIPTKIFPNTRICRRCKTEKPERAHHCSVCNRCIKKMDHHCSWLGTCINHDNLGHFLRFMFFSSFATLLGFFYLSYSTITRFQKNPYMFVIYVETTFCLAEFFVFFVTFSFFVTVLRNIMFNITYLEKLSADNTRRIGIDPGSNPYDLGIYTNFTSVMGKPYSLFLFGGPIGDGVTFLKTENLEYWPQKKRIAFRCKQRNNFECK